MTKLLAIAVELIVGVLYVVGFVRSWRRQRATVDSSVHRIYTGVLLMCVAVVAKAIGVAILLDLYWNPRRPGLLIIQASTLAFVFAGHILVRTDYDSLRSAFPRADGDG